MSKMPKEDSNLPHNRWVRTSMIDQTVNHLCTSYYVPSNKHWEITFRALKFSRQTIDNMWTVFYRINKSHTGIITMFEFLNYFNLERTAFIEKCFNYFDCTGDNTIDFLKFVIAVFNICTLNVDTLTTFAFDIFDDDKGGMLSLPEIERLVQELYGEKLSTGEVLNDINHFAEQRGGTLTLESFTIYTGNHSMLLLPVFRVQRKIQCKVMGVHYWKQLQRMRPDVAPENQKHGSVFNARYVQTLLRKYKEGGVQAMLDFCGDPNDTLLKFYMEKEDGQHVKYAAGDATSIVNESELVNRESRIKNQKFKSAVDKVKKINTDQRQKLKHVLATAKDASHKTVDSTAAALVNAGARSRKRITKVSSSLKIKVAAFSTQGPKRSTTNKRETNTVSAPNAQVRPLTAPSSHTTIGRGILDSAGIQQERAPSQRTPRRHKERKIRPKTAQNKTNHDGRRGKFARQHPSGVDHKMYFPDRARPRTAGNIAFSINNEGNDF